MVYRPYRDLSKEGYLHFVKLLSKKSLIQIFDDVIANQDYNQDLNFQFNCKSRSGKRILTNKRIIHLLNLKELYQEHISVLYRSGILSGSKYSLPVPLFDGDIAESYQGV